MGIICESCGRDIDALGQDNMSCVDAPLCEDCWNEQQSRPSIEVRCPKCGMREIWHHLPKGGDRCRWCGHLFEDFTYRKVGPSAKEGAQ